MNFTIKKTSVFTVFLKNGPIWDLCFFKNISFYNEFGIFLSACFKNIGFYSEFCMLFAQDETKTYLCSKTSVFTMNYAHFFKNIRFYNELFPKQCLHLRGSYFFFPKQCLHLRGSYFSCKESFLNRRNAGRFPPSSLD